ncbi:MAG: polyprenol monophosphomannose synthase [Candidatus Berkelbacteria bacterium]|nr:polyprenol monophosphomannose synthase [Candidatus Berkelbacteria bacterium]
MKVLIILPTYNEKDNVKHIIEAIYKIDKNFHILVVDDNSPDKTGKVVKKIMKKNPHVSLIERDFKEGIGPAYLVGFHYGLKHKYDYIIQMDADLSHDTEMIPGMLALCTGKNWVIGSRYTRGGKIIGWEAQRKFLSWFGNWYTKLILGFKIKDWTAGFCVWPKEILASFDLNADEFPNGYSFQIALKQKALDLGYEPIEVPITFRERRHGKTKIAGGIINEAAVTVLRLKFSKNHRRKPKSRVK